MAKQDLSYEEFLNYCSRNRKNGLKILNEIRRYQPFVFIKDEMITICAGFKVISDLSKILKPRATSEYKAWRKYILNRDDYRCTKCGAESNLHVHHIEYISENHKKATDKENGITLCNICHRKKHGRYKNDK